MKFKILDMLISSDDFLSGEAIGNKLNISRAAVNKNISKLKQMGYKINAVNNKGYKLIKEYDILNNFELEKGLETKFLARKSAYFDEIDSTNEQAKAMAADNENGFMVFSDSQSAGKGRLGRIWQSEKGKALYFSFVLKPKIEPNQAPVITLICAVAVARAIKKLSGLDVKIKWPNDIVVNGKKLVGILTEMSAEIDMIKYIVVGIGINVNNSCFDDEIAFKATSLFIESGKSFSRIKILQQCLKEIENCWFVFEKEGFSPFRDEYKKLCANIGMQVKLVNKEITAAAVDISQNGELVLETEKGERIKVFGGEVSIRRADGAYI